MQRTVRYLIAFVLLAAGGAKLADLPGFVAVLHSYRFFPYPLIWPLAAATVAVELLLALWLIWGRFPLAAAQASIALHSAYTGWTLFMLLRSKPILNCGCFGSLLARPLSWMTVVEDLVMVALSVILYTTCRRKSAES
jgi:uncharacterized membrane protein YphA (DoxX/SURF4 family)